MVTVHHRTISIQGEEVFYREGGSRDAPVMLLLHGYPTSSHMFRHLIPVLGEQYRVIAPDSIGFGRSSAPSVDDFEYSFDALAAVTQSLIDAVGIPRYTVYAHDDGAPIAWRLALAEPSSVQGVISQNGNAYEEGLVPEFWAPIWAYGQDPSPENEIVVRAALDRAAVERRYLHGVPDPTAVDPDAWEHDLALLARPGNDRVQLALFRDHMSNRALYPGVQDWLRTSRVPVLAIWGRNDEIFGPAGAEAFRRDAPEARVDLLDGGHFLLESHLDEVVDAILDWRAAF